jgi:hypothetical protein
MGSGNDALAEKDRTADARIHAAPLALFVFKIGKIIYLYRHRVKAPDRQYLCGCAGWYLPFAYYCEGVLQGFFTSGVPFFRTPKKADSRPLLKALLAAREELLFMIALMLAAGP